MVDTLGFPSKSTSLVWDAHRVGSVASGKMSGYKRWPGMIERSDCLDVAGPPEEPPKSLTEVMKLAIDSS
jgi:hypothetical protein